jgi:hypothetical protein
MKQGFLWFLICGLSILMVGTIVAQSGANATNGKTDRALTAPCDRACLNGFIDQYLTALVANDPSQLPVTKTVKFSENGQMLPLGDGLWNTATGKGTYKLYITDPEDGQVAFFGTIREAGVPTILAVRLKVEKQQVSEIETLVARQPDGARSLEKLGTPNPVFEEAIPPAERASRQELIRTANMYFSGIQMNDGKGVYPFSDDCNRIENGMQTTNNPSFVQPPLPDAYSSPSDPAQKHDPAYSAAWSCKQQLESGLLHFVTRVRDRRFVVVDRERGLVLAFVFFDHAAGKYRTFQVPDGRTVTVGHTTPWTWEIAELFKIKKGKIGQIEALVEHCPYGMGSGWSTREEALSSQAR